MSDTTDLSILTPIQKLKRDMRLASRTLGAAEARFLVDAYYKIQEDRIRSAHQVRTLAEPKIIEGEAERIPEPHEVIQWLQHQEETLEGQIRGALDTYSGASIAGQWMRSIVGIGPVIAAGLLANIDIERAPTVGHIWRFAGLDPTVRWERGKKRPWNASLKRLCWLIGESFVKVSNHERDVYGKLYQKRKEWEAARNEAGAYAEQAAASLAEKKFGKDTQARKHYEAGKLPPARIHRRAERFATKIFLSHMHEVWWFTAMGELPAKPFVLEHVGGHVHKIEVPNRHLVPGLEAAHRT